MRVVSNRLRARRHRSLIYMYCTIQRTVVYSTVQYCTCTYVTYCTVVGTALNSHQVQPLTDDTLIVIEVTIAGGSIEKVKFEIEFSQFNPILTVLELKRWCSYYQVRKIESDYFNTVIASAIGACSLQGCTAKSGLTARPLSSCTVVACMHTIG